MVFIMMILCGILFMIFFVYCIVAEKMCRCCFSRRQKVKQSVRINWDFFVFKLYFNFVFFFFEIHFRKMRYMKSALHFWPIMTTIIQAMKINFILNLFKNDTHKKTVIYAFCSSLCCLFYVLIYK